MEQIAEQITENLLQDLPDQSQFFTFNELLSSGAPRIVVETLRKNVLSAVNSELKMPESEWIQAEHEQVQKAWQSFVETSREHLQVPASSLSYLLTEAVEQCLELALKPRQSVVEIIFRTRDTMDLETVKKRIDSLEVNKYLGLALLRYMERKEKQEITLDKARELIKKVDQRLVNDYHPLNWAQALKPVFELAGPSVDPDLFRIFFEDKEKPAFARKFELLDERLTETDFIEVLSSADMLDVEAYEDDHPELFVPVEEDAEPEKVVEIEETADEEFRDDKNVIAPEDHDTSDEWVDEEQEIPEETTEDFEVDGAKDEDKEDYEPVEPVQTKRTQEAEDETLPEEQHNEGDITGKEADKQKDNIVDLFSQMKSDNLIEGEGEGPVLTLVEDEDESDENNENITLLSKFMFDESVDEALEDVPDDPKFSEQKEPASIYEEMNLIKEDHSNITEEEDFIEESPEKNEEAVEELSFKIEAEDEEPNEIEKEAEIQIEEETDEPDDDKNDQPMWRSFLERDDLETDSGYEYEEELEDEQVDLREDEFEEDEDGGFIEEPIYDLTTDQEDSEEKIKRISGWLDDEKDRFVDDIFMGSELAYEEALIEITDYDNWKAASMYLEREVFSRNKIDVYDEVAVDFTDRLHSYFLEHNSKQDK